MIPARVNGIVAREADRAVIFRRGPSKQTLQLVWDLETDEITPGQWIKGRVYEYCADVSPDGKYLVASALNYSRSNARNSYPEVEGWMKNCWTAVSRPPYFTAIGLWFSGSTWDMGGLWESNTHLKLGSARSSYVEAKPAPSFIKVSDGRTSRARVLSVSDSLFLKRGWTLVSSYRASYARPFFKAFAKSLWNVALGKEPENLSGPLVKVHQEGLWTKQLDSGVIRRIERGVEFEWQLMDLEGKMRKNWVIPGIRDMWVDTDANSCLIFADQGCLFRWRTFPDGEPEMVADLNHYSFESVAPPEWATQW